MFLTRVILVAQSIYLNQISGNISDILKVMLLGEISDLSALLYVITPISFIYLILPKILINNKFAKF